MPTFGFTGDPVHPGNWFGLPDFGITEAIQKRFNPNRPRTPQGGSNLIAPPYQTQASNAAVQTNQSSQSVPRQSLPAVLGTQTNSSGGGGTSNGGQQTQSSGDVLGIHGNYQFGAQEAPQQPGINWDALIGPALQSLDESINALSSGFASNQQNIESQKSTQLAQSNQQIGEQVTGLEQRKTRQAGMAESAANEARRQFAEIQQGLQSRYGKTTGTGGFAESIAGSQAMRNIAGIRQQLSDAMTEADNKIQQVKEIGRISLLDIEDKTRMAITDTRERLENQLGQLRREKGELQSRKAELAMNALQNYQNTVNSINAQNAAFKQNLIISQQQAENNLKLAMQKAQQTAESFTMRNLEVGGVTTPVLVGNKTGQIQYPNIPAGGNLYNLGTEKKKDPYEEILSELNIQTGQ